MWKVEFSPESLADVQNAFGFYLEKGVQTGEAFIQVLEASRTVCLCGLRVPLVRQQH